MCPQACRCIVFVVFFSVVLDLRQIADRYKNRGEDK